MLLARALSLLLLSALASAQCGRRCRFRFCGPAGAARPAGARLLLRAPNTALSARLCRPGRLPLARVLASGEANVSAAGGAPAPASQFAPAGLAPPLRRDFFKVFPLPTGRQGVGRKRSFGNQERFLDGLCVVLPMERFEVARGKGGVRVREGDERDCVSFVTSNPAVLVELSWNTRDNLDLAVEEPDGDVVSREKPRSENGRLTNDNNVGCGRGRSGKEAVVYGSAGEVETGGYTAVVRHTRNCGGPRTRWKVRIVVRGELVKVEKGFSEGGGGQVIAEVPFNVPEGASDR